MVTTVCVSWPSLMRVCRVTWPEHIKEGGGALGLSLEPCTEVLLLETRHYGISASGARSHSALSLSHQPESVQMHQFARISAVKSPLIAVFRLSSIPDSCNSCSTKCSSSKWLWGQQRRRRGGLRSSIPPANQEVKGRGACRSLCPSPERLQHTGHEWLYCALYLPHCGDQDFVPSLSFSS